MMRKKNNNMRNRNGGGHQGGGGRRFHNNNGGGGNRGNDGQNIQRQKHHATQMREKFSNMARDAQNNGDRVDVEYYLQHVEHYTRVLADIAVIEAERFAHQREQQAQHATEHAPAGEAENNGDAGEPVDAAAADAESPAPIVTSNQPRMTRGPRRDSRPQHQQQAAAANENTNEIPLPDNILPVI